ncbi:hypothetical protein [Streptomyces sp. S063]|uniref:hypothetical protein n=1 Tax=Streptomyces sp. S063 TaxID=2005885 RepID=UPI00100816E8|nr:hypothetical protein [Streptomyces sp. S063]
MSVRIGSTANLYDLVTHKRTGSMRHRGDGLRFGSQGRFLVGWGNDGTTIDVWARGSEEPLFTVTAPTGQGDKGMYAHQLALDEEAERLRYFSTTTGRLYEIDLAGALSGRADRRVTAAVSAGGRFGLVRSAPSSVDPPTLQAVDLRTGEPVGDLVAQREGGDALEGEELFASIDDEGRVMAYSYRERVSRYETDDEVVVRDVREGKNLHRVPVAANHRPLHLAVSPNGRHLSLVSQEFGVNSADSHIHEVWDIEKRTKIRQFNDRTAEAVFSHDGERLVTAAGTEVTLADGAVRKTGLARDPGGRPVFSPTVATWRCSRSPAGWSCGTVRYANARRCWRANWCRARPGSGSPSATWPSPPMAACSPWPFGRGGPALGDEHEDAPREPPAHHGTPGGRPRVRGHAPAHCDRLRGPQAGPLAGPAGGAGVPARRARHHPSGVAYVRARRPVPEPVLSGRADRPRRSVRRLVALPELGVPVVDGGHPVGGAEHPAEVGR